MKHKAFAVVSPLAIAAVFALTHACAAQSAEDSLYAANTIPDLVAVMGMHGFGGGFAGSEGYLGIGMRDVSEDQLPILKLKEVRGAEVIQVDHDGPAGQAGLREHDVILQMNGQIIEGEEQLRRILRETPAGRKVVIVLSRDGQQMTVSTQLANRAAVERQAWERHLTVPSPAPLSAPMPGYVSHGFVGGPPLVDQDMQPSAPPITAPPDAHSHSLIGGTIVLGSSYTGAVVEMIGPQLAQFFGSQGGNGLLVRSVEPSTPSATAGMRAGDVVVRANAVIIASIADWYRIVRENKGRPLAVTIVRDKQEQTLTLIPDAKKRSALAPEDQPSHLDPFDSIPVAEYASKHGLVLYWMN
jgi:S1-C subfamily serine protease